MTLALSIQGLRVSYGAVEVLHGLDLTVPRGEIRVILGANAAGKSTLIKAILGLVDIHGGSILLDETLELRGMQPHEISKVGVAWIPQGRMIFSMLTVNENLLLGAFNEPRKERVREQLEAMFSLFPVLRGRRHKSAGSLSGGEQQMLSIARALMSNPRVVLMDEPSVGLAPKVLHEVFDLVTHINSTGVSILLVEQNARQALRVATWAYVLERGQIVSSGSAAEIEAGDSISKAYLGNY